MQVRKDTALGETPKWKITAGLFQREKAMCGMGKGCYADRGVGPTKSGAEPGCYQRGDLVQFSKNKKLQEEKKHV